MKTIFYSLANKNFSKYLYVGASSYLIVAIITTTLHEVLGVMESNSFATALVVVFVINFFVLRNYVFKSESNTSSAAIKFFISSLFFRGFEYILFIIILDLGVYYMTSLTVSMVVSVISKYFVYKYAVYN